MASVPRSSAVIARSSECGWGCRCASSRTRAGRCRPRRVRTSSRAGSARAPRRSRDRVPRPAWMASVSNFMDDAGASYSCRPTTSIPGPPCAPSALPIGTQPCVRDVRQAQFLEQPLAVRFAVGVADDQPVGDVVAHAPPHPACELRLQVVRPNSTPPAVTLPVAVVVQDGHQPQRIRDALDPARHATAAHRVLERADDAERARLRQDGLRRGDDALRVVAGRRALRGIHGDAGPGPRDVPAVDHGDLAVRGRASGRRLVPRHRCR